MSVATSELYGGSAFRKPLRLWPGVVIVVVQWLLRFAVPVVAPDYMQRALLGSLLCAPLLVLWWLFFSRAPWLERLGVPLLMAAAVAVTYRLVDPSIATGAMGFLLAVLSIPFLSLLLVVWAAATPRLAARGRWAALAAGIVLVCGAFTLLRTGGFSGDFGHELAWRWSETPEDRLLAQAEDEVLVAAAPGAPHQAQPATAADATVPSEESAATEAQPATSEGSPAAAPPATSPAPAPEPVMPAADAATPLGSMSAAAPAAAPAAPAAAAPAAWPGFRGAGRDGVVRGVRIATDWSASPPLELWRRAVGPGWSSFAVDGDVFYTQEQRGEEEVVSCYRLSDGAPVWRHADAARFWESNAGAGPRATPTLHGGRVITLGATGILNVLDAADGSLVWSRNPAQEHDVEVPGWGFAGSPLAVGDVVIAAVSGRLAAYDLATGEPRWTLPSNGGGYSSPHLLTIDGVTQVLFQRGKAAVSVAPADGTVLWEHPWESVSIVQPAQTAEGDVLLTDNDYGTRRIAVAHDATWSVEERWTSIFLKPYFNDFVVHEGHAYGFDGSMLASLDLADGKRAWKGGRYGAGQLVLLADQEVLLVISERGELALVAATPGGYRELARHQAIEGKTWNHPVVVGDVLLVRNDREMAAFRLPHEGG